MKIINLTNGKKCLVDDEDYIELRRHNWNSKIISGKEYVYRTRVRYPPLNGKKFETIYIHNAILKRYNIKHIDGDGLNNQRYNLIPRVIDKFKKAAYNKQWSMMDNLRKKQKKRQEKIDSFALTQDDLDLIEYIKEMELMNSI